MSLPPSRVLQRKCACGKPTSSGGECEACRKKREGSMLQRSSTSASSVRNVPPIVHEVLRSPGQRLDAGTREFMEPRFARDFSHVRIHADAKASESARLVNASAYTVGRDIVIDNSHVPYDTERGRSLIAHELTHVVQQEGMTADGAPRHFGGDEHGPAEAEADRAAEQIMGGMSGVTVSATAAPSLHRKVNVQKPKDPIPNPTGKGVSQTNAETIESYLQTLCSGGSVSVNKATGSVSVAAGFCPKPMPKGVAGPVAPAPANASKEPVGCSCLCDMVDSANDFTIVVDDKDWPHTAGRVVTTPSPNSPKLWGAATASGKTMNIDPWLVLGHELCGHAWLAEQGLRDDNATRGEGGHQETVARENQLRAEHGIEARGTFKEPYCGESFWRDKAGPGPVQWSPSMAKCEAWRIKTYGKKYKISDKIP